jgi:hypothetical protein
MLHTDSKVVSKQIEKECIAREPTLEKHLSPVQRMENNFKGFTVQYIEQSKITKAVDLIKAVARNIPMPADVFFKFLRMLRSK